MIWLHGRIGTLDWSPCGMGIGRRSASSWRRAATAAWSSAKVVASHPQTTRQATQGDSLWQTIAW